MLQVSEPIVDAHVPTLRHHTEPHLLQQRLLAGHFEHHLRLHRRAAAARRRETPRGPGLPRRATEQRARPRRRGLRVHHLDRQGGKPDQPRPQSRPPDAPELPPPDRRVPAGQVDLELETAGLGDGVAGGDDEREGVLAAGREDVDGEGDIVEGEARWRERAAAGGGGPEQREQAAVRRRAPAAGVVAIALHGKEAESGWVLGAQELGPEVLGGEGLAAGGGDAGGRRERLGVEEGTHQPEHQPRRFRSQHWRRRPRGLRAHANARPFPRTRDRAVSFHRRASKHINQSGGGRGKQVAERNQSIRRNGLPYIDRLVGTARRPNWMRLRFHIRSSTSLSTCL